MGKLVPLLHIWSALWPFISINLRWKIFLKKCYLVLIMVRLTMVALNM